MCSEDIIMKKCSSCKETKPLDDFHKRKDAKDGRQSRCKLCMKSVSHESHKKVRVGNKEKFVKYLGSSCKICGYSKYQGALEFHHRDPSEKDFHISQAYHKSWGEVKMELDKCVLLCSNCHKEVHAGVVHLSHK